MSNLTREDKEDIRDIVETAVKGFVTKDDLKEELERFATKDDLENFPTKDDLKAFATKEDLKNFATKNDLEAFATRDDLKSFATKQDVREIVRDETADIRDEQLRHGVLLEDLDDTVKKLAESVSQDLKHKKRVDDHDERIDALESKEKLVIATVAHHSVQIKNLQAGKR